MERIYFDKQIFSHLFNSDRQEYRDFLALLKANSDNFLYCYSQGHLQDLQNDKTNIKYDELAFMETLVGDNYLSYDATEKRTSCYLATPLEAFKDYDKDEEPLSILSALDNIDLSSMSDEQRMQIENAKELIATQKIDFSFTGLKNLLSEKDTEAVQKVLPLSSGSMTLLDWSNHLMNLLSSMNEDKSIYKGFRNIVDANLNQGRFTVKYDSIDFNDDLKNSELKKTFIEYVTGNLNPNGEKEVTEYDFYLNAYLSLDLLGISKEPSKAVKFRNLMNDGYHSYYGAFCDYVVSDDKGFLKKTKTMYRLLGIETKVFDIVEFMSHFPLLIRSIELDSRTFIKLLVNDLKHGLVVGSKNSVKSNRHTTTIKPTHNYLGYFNSLQTIREDGKEFILLRRKTKNYSYFSFFREHAGIVNIAVKIFGIDDNYRSEFSSEKELKEISDGSWEGRFWNFDVATIHLQINEGINELCLLITIQDTEN